MSSQIANALSKARERTGLTSAPFMIPGHAPKAAAIPKYKNTQRRWVIIMSIVMVVGGAFIWSSNQFGASEKPVKEAPHATASASVQGPAATPDAPQQSRPEPRAEIQDLVKSLVISAVMPGTVPRMIMQGRVIKVGEAVEQNLKFSGIKDGNLVFTDEFGAVYTRRY